MKKCTGCGDEHPLEYFSKKGSGRATRCKKCVAAYYRNYYHGSEERKAYVKAATSANRKKNHLRNRAKRHGLSESELKSMISQTNGLCWACHDREWDHIDHDHRCCSGNASCGKCVRGLLCARCNQTMGWAKDDPKVLGALLRYLDSRIPSL